jgi:galactokinase
MTRAGPSGAGQAARWSAPGRVNIIGEHTDYNQGLVLPIAIPQRTAATVTPRQDDVLTFRSAQAPGRDATVRLGDLEPSAVPGWSAYAAGVVWALRQEGAAVGGADIVVDGQVPEGAGLSSSAALECAVAAAIDDSCRLGIPPLELALLAQRAENDFVGVPCGAMDQIAAMCCREGHALLVDLRRLSLDHVRFAPAEQGLALLIIDTRSPHRHRAGEYAARRADCDAAAHQLGVPSLRDASPADVERLREPRLRRRARHVVTEIDRVARAAAVLGSADSTGLGPLLTESHRSLRDDFEVSSAELDVAVDAVLDAGALGARMTGGGFGGSVIALVADAKMAEAESAVRSAFARCRFGAPVVSATRACGGAARLPI